MSVANRLVHALYMLGTAGGYLRFISGLENFRQKQNSLLLSLIKKNRSTLFGKEHHFDKIHDMDSFRQHVPIREYEHFEPYIRRIGDGEKEVLTAGDVLLLEPTGGTTSGSKLVPYTRALKKEFQKAVNPWLFDFYKSYPQLLKGKSYWSITPALTEKKYTACGIPIGFEEDGDYLGFMGNLLKKILVAPKAVNRVKDAGNFRYVTAYFLLTAKDLSLLSFWNPTFLTLILETLEQHFDSLVRDIAVGVLSPPQPENLDFLAPYLAPAPARAAEIKETARPKERPDYSRIWKHLCVISCWTSGFAQHYAKKLKNIFPGVTIQGKGLIATEGIVTIPLAGRGDTGGGYLPAYASHFFEFLEQGAETGTETRLLHQLETGKEYTIILTTSGGLYRYNLKDRVLVTGKHRGLPLLQFTGRDNVCDLVGEKLDSGHVRRVVESSLEEYGMDVEFIMLAPEITANGCYYTLFFETKGSVGSSTLDAFKSTVEKGLAENFHYRYARDLGQVGPLRHRVIESGGLQTYFNRCTREGQRIGDIKPNLLDKRTGWNVFFA